MCVKSSSASVKSFTLLAYSILCQDGKSVLKMKETLWKNNLIFTKDVPMIYVNLILTVIIMSEKK